MAYWLHKEINACALASTKYSTSLKCPNARVLNIVSKLKKKRTMTASLVDGIDRLVNKGTPVTQICTATIFSVLIFFICCFQDM